MISVSIPSRRMSGVLPSDCFIYKAAMNIVEHVSMFYVGASLGVRLEVVYLNLKVAFCPVF